MKTIYALLGTLCVGLGAIGTVVPGMPTTVFLIVAAWLYARSCPGLHRRLIEHRVFGPTCGWRRSVRCPGGPRSWRWR